MAQLLNFFALGANLQLTSKVGVDSTIVMNDATLVASCNRPAAWVAHVEVFGGSLLHSASALVAYVAQGTATLAASQTAESNTVFLKGVASSCADQLHSTPCVSSISSWPALFYWHAAALHLNILLGASAPTVAPLT